MLADDLQLRRVDGAGEHRVATLSSFVRKNVRIVNAAPSLYAKRCVRRRGSSKRGRLADGCLRLLRRERAESESAVHDLRYGHGELLELTDEVLAHAQHDFDVGRRRRLREAQYVARYAMAPDHLAELGR